MSNSQIRAFEQLKVASEDAEVVRLITDGRLPFEVVVPAVKKTSPEVWTALLKNAPYMNLLRNLVTFTRHDVFKSEENVALTVAKLTNPRAIEKSRVLPFRFFDAWKAYSASEHDERIADALRVALELSFVNLPSFGSRVVAIGSDTSGSMYGALGKGSTRFIDICGIFTGALMKQCEGVRAESEPFNPVFVEAFGAPRGRVIPLPFDTEVHVDHSLSARDDILVTAEKIASYGGGGTAVGAPVQYLLDRKIGVDVFVGITDSEDWASGYGYDTRGSFLDLWREYRKQYPSAVAFLVTISPYRDGLAPQHEPGVHFIYGWSDQVLKYIMLRLENGVGQIEDVERMEFGKPSEPESVSEPESEPEVEDA